MLCPASRRGFREGVLVCFLASFVFGLGASSQGAAIPFSLPAAKVLYEGRCDPVFEEPELDSEALLFLPTAFEALSESADPPTSLVDGTIILTITALEDALHTITFREGGDYTLSGGLSYPSKAYVEATLLAYCVSLEVNGQPVTGLHPNVTSSFNRSASFLAGDDSIHGFWDLTATLDFDEILADTALQGNVTKVKLSIDNTLIAKSQMSSVAFIAKKWLYVEVDVPEPSFLTLLICGCCALVARRRR